MTNASSAGELRIGVVGCGGSRQTFGPALARLHGACPAAFMDVDIIPARLWAKQARGARAYCDFDEFVAESDTHAVIVASPPDVRAHHVAQLLRAGKHVLAETPMAPTASIGLELCDLARRSGLVLLPALPLRYEPALTEAEQRVRAGSIGEVRELRCEWAYSSAWSERKAIFGSWPAALLRHSIRTLDVARRMLGEAHAVSADIDRAGSHRRGGNLANLIVQHDRGVSVHHIHRTSRRARFEQYVLTGTVGMLELAAPAAGALDGSSVFFLSARSAGSHNHETSGPFCDPEGSDRTDCAIDRLLADFVRTALGNASPRVTGYDAVAAQAVFEAALVSSAEGLKLTVTAPARAAIAAV
ncbi:MAG: Gfo/Idh/MocA family oxidoreductase [Chthonomonadales bacterium]|nr:Gfo/Idh/MocA family oxidoreductase [Chthonomonadales bacterium]